MQITHKAMDAHWLENAKCYIFEIPPKKSSLFLYL